MHAIADLEYRLMSCCLKRKGRFWENHFFRNREVNELYSTLRKESLDEVLELLENS